MRTSNDEDVQDIIQETMIDAYKYIKKLKKPSKFKSWITKILINNCNKYYKKYNVHCNIKCTLFIQILKIFNVSFYATFISS